MASIDTIRDWFLTQRFNRDQTLFRKNKQIEGVFPSAIIHWLMWELEAEVHKMAGKDRTKVFDFSKIEFINRNLKEEEAKAFETWAKSENERLPDILGQIMVDDYKVSCNWDDRNQCYIATFTGKDTQRINDNKALSSRSDDWFEALAMNAYKHLVLFKGGKWEGETTKNNWG